MTSFATVTPAHVQQLAELVGSQHVSTAAAVRHLRAQDMSRHRGQAPEVVVWPGAAAKVAAVLGLAQAERIPVTPWGAGSSLEGNPIPLHGGISLSMERLDALLAVHADDFQVTVQPGMGYKDLNEKLRPYGLFFAPDPGANATIGGMLANNAGGIRTVKYGASKDNVLQMEVALADGRLIRVGSRSVKQASGYDLLHLFVGSEGTLGVITEATLQLAPVPRFMSAVTAGFATVEEAVEAVVAVRGSGVDVAALELLDGVAAELLAQEHGLELKRRPSLLIELHAAHAQSIQLELDLVREICVQLGAISVRATADAAERRRIWQARHHLFEIIVRRHPGWRWISMDVAVPLSAFPQLIAFANDTVAEQGLYTILLGHAGDGNIHVTIGYEDEDTQRRAESANKQIIHQALELGGTASGEHGVGFGKLGTMQREHGAALGVMRALKETLDPQGILNPGKIFPH